MSSTLLTKQLDAAVLHAEKLGLSHLDITSLASIKSISSAHRSRWYIDPLALLSLAIAFSSILLAASLSLVLVGIYGNSMDQMWRIWAEDVMGFDTLEGEKCLIPVPMDAVRDVMRPPLSCDFCSRVSEFVEIKYDNISRSEFERLYAYSGVPVVVRGATDGWSAPHVFSFQYFHNVYVEGESFMLKEEAFDKDKGCQFFPYETEFDNLTEVLTMSAERFEEPWYVGWSNCDGKVASELRRHYKRPSFLPEQAESSRLDWIFMGRGVGKGAHLHVDSVDYPSWQAQVKGRKRWILEPPPECYFLCPHHNINVIIEPGDIIALDTNWWFHKTEVVGTDVSIVIGSEYD